MNMRAFNILALVTILAIVAAAPMAAAQTSNNSSMNGAPGAGGAPPEESTNGPLILFILVISVLVSAVAGFFVGTMSSRPHTSGLQVSLSTNRPRVQQTALRLKGVSGKIAQNDRAREMSGPILVMSTTLTNVANDLTRLENGLRKRGGSS